LSLVSATDTIVLETRDGWKTPPAPGKAPAALETGVGDGPLSGPNWKRTVPLPAAVRLVWHGAEPYPRDVPLEDFYANLDLVPGQDGLPVLMANMIMTMNGEAVIAGRAAPIGTAVDRFVLTRLRISADVLLYGSGTLRAEDVTGVTPEQEAARRIAAGRRPRLVAALLASDLAWGPEVLARRFFTDQRFDRLIITGDRPAAGDIRRIEALGVAVARVEAGPDGRPAVRAALRLLGDRGARVVLTEGGPRVLASLMAARLVSNYFLTMSPLATGNPQVLRPIGDWVGSDDRPLLLSRVSRHEYAFQDPDTGAPLVEAYERFRVVYR
jgi:riboflavin biosynthesis pyrimidine reductase